MLVGLTRRQTNKSWLNPIWSSSPSTTSVWWQPQRMTLLNRTIYRWRNRHTDMFECWGVVRDSVTMSEWLKLTKVKLSEEEEEEDVTSPESRMTVWWASPFGFYQDHRMWVCVCVCAVYVCCDSQLCWKNWQNNQDTYSLQVCTGLCVCVHPCVSFCHCGSHRASHKLSEDCIILFNCLMSVQLQLKTFLTSQEELMFHYLFRKYCTIGVCCVFFFITKPNLDSGCK